MTTTGERLLSWASEGTKPRTVQYKGDDHGDATRMWNLAPLIPEVERFTRVYRGRGELVDHLMVGHALTKAVESVTIGGADLSSATDSPGGRDDAEASDHRPVVATF
ncbi:hypothetical protein [Nesterenkonia sp. F]|uniref:hypothetical protein n=1 Tax=Nesterenkonia sp. F TaxID=795955 RepID=UPI0011126744|nr:hypothetical protein [Nesterenkonia sp. F]